MVIIIVVVFVVIVVNVVFFFNPLEDMGEEEGMMLVNFIMNQYMYY